MRTQLTAYIDGRRVGTFRRDGSGPVTFTFDEEWRRGARRRELSLSMPKTLRQHTGTAPLNYLWNLLPDSEAVLERWGSKFGVSPRNPIALLAHVGMDTAGAVQLADSYAEHRSSVRRVGRHYGLREIEARHVIADGAALGFDPGWAHGRAVAIVDGLADAYSAAARDAISPVMMRRSQQPLSTAWPCGQIACGAS